MSVNVYRVMGVGLFFSAIVFGMHVAGQTVYSKGEMPPAGSADLQSIQKLMSSMPKNPGQPASAPAFGPEAMKMADQISSDSGDTTPKPKPRPAKTQAPEEFSPSSVETFKKLATKQSDPRAILHTSAGTITIRLYPNYAPKNVRNFIDLARGDREFIDSRTARTVRRPFYNDLTFHRVLPGYLIQTGCPIGNGRGTPGYTVPDEFATALRFNKPGMVAMAPARKELGEKKDTNGSQFFITLAELPDFDEKYTIIGEVEKGMSVVRKISKSPTGPTDRPIKRVFLHKIEVIEEGAADPLPATSEPAKADEAAEAPAGP